MTGLLASELVEYVRSLGMEGGDGERFDPAGGCPDARFAALVQSLARATAQSEAELLRRFGAWMLPRLARMYPVFFRQPDGLFGFVRSLDERVHRDLRRFNPRVDPPRLVCTAVEPGRVVLEYRSTRPLADLAEGLLRGCIEHFREDVLLERQPLPGTPGGGARFVLSARTRSTSVVD